MDIQANVTSVNIAEKMDEDDLKKIGRECVEGYENDLASRSHWERDLEEWTKLAIQVREEKSYPWPKASNVKYPLLSTAAMQFTARAYPIIVPSDGKVVKCRVIGSDPQGVKAARAARISEHMSYQVMEEMYGWEEDTDRLLMVLSIAGTVFRKTYRDTLNDVNESSLVLPRDLVVNYWTKCLEKASRVTQRIKFTKNEVQERINSGIFLDLELPTPSSFEQDYNDKTNRVLSNTEDDELVTPYLFLEQHTWLDLDDDGYKEPYVVTLDYNTKKVFRITARFDQTGIKFNEEGKIARIIPKQYFTKYGFIPNPDGGFYDLGFGVLLGALNESANTLVNQLIDAGTLSNLQSGFLSKGLRVKLGDTRFTPGEWKQVNATMDDLKKGIFPMPVREPSMVLFQLLGMIVQSTKELASVAEIFVGKMPGQNTPATTTQSTIEQGMKVFTSIFKRVYRSLTEEFRKLYALNREYIDPQKYVDILDNPASLQDYQGPENDVVPAADPQAQTDSMKQQKAQAIMQVAQMGGLDMQATIMRFLEANGVEDIQALLPKPPAEPPPPPPEVMKIQLEMQLKQQEGQMKQQLAQFEFQVKQKEAQMEMQLKQFDIQIKQMELELERAKAEIELKKAGMDMQVAHAKHQMDVTHQQENLALKSQTNRMKAATERSKQKETTNRGDSNQG